MGLFIRTYAALSELFGIYGRGEVEAPGVARARVLPVHEALAGLADPRAGLHQPHVQNLVNLRIGFVYTDVLSRYNSDLAVVGGDVEHELRVVPHAGDVDGDEVLAHLLPLHRPRPARRHVEHLRP